MSVGVFYPPSWPADEWDVFTLLVEEAWKGEWTNRKAKAYGLLLDSYEPAAVIDALRSLAGKGGPFMPTVPEIIGAIVEDVTVPTWTEAFELLGRATHAACRRGRGSDEQIQAAIVERLSSQHPYLAAFAGQVGAKRLRYAPFDDPDEGKWERKRLREEWDQFVERADGRRREGRPIELDAPARRRELTSGPRRLDSAALIGAPTEDGHVR